MRGVEKMGSANSFSKRASCSAGRGNSMMLSSATSGAVGCVNKMRRYGVGRSSSKAGFMEAASVTAARELPVDSKSCALLVCWYFDAEVLANGPEKESSTELKDKLSD